MIDVFSDPRSRGPDLEIRLEVAGLAVEPTADNNSYYRLYVPENLRLQGADYGDEKNPKPWQWIEGEDYLVWNSVSPVDIDAGRARRLLLDLARYSGASPQDIRAFTATWGILAPEPYEERRLDEYLNKEGSFPLDRWETLAHECRALLSLLAETSAARWADDELMEAFYDNYNFDLLSTVEVIQTRTTYVEQYTARRAAWKTELQSPQRQALQRRLVENKLNSLLALEKPIFLWDEDGRRFVRASSGVWEIAVAQLQEVFAAPQVGVFVCSVCKRPYDRNDSPATRRPRSGVRNFCSDDCRLEAKRESNRQSWQRNGTKWRPPGSRSVSKERENDG